MSLPCKRKTEKKDDVKEMRVEVAVDWEAITWAVLKDSMSYSRLFHSSINSKVW